MTQITFQDGKPVLRDGKVGVGQGCCCDTPASECVYAWYCHPGKGGEGWVVRDFPFPPAYDVDVCCTVGASQGCNVLLGATTVSKPAAMVGRQVLVTIAGSMDDDIAIDGVFVGPSCTPGFVGFFAFTLAANDSSFELSNVDSYGACAHGTLSICFEVTSAPPSLSISGTAVGVFSFNLLANARWSVKSVAVTSGGSGYAEEQSVSFVPGAGVVTETAGAAIARVVHAAPTNPTFDIATDNGSGAVLSPVWGLLPPNQWPAPHKKTYRLMSVTVLDGGSGYGNYDPISISFPSPEDGTVSQPAWIDCDVVGAGGVIQSVWVADYSDIFTPAAAGKYIGSRTSALHSVVVTNGGAYLQGNPFP